MKILVVGAGGIGGYFGGRLLQKGADVTFLVRENRKKQLEENGLQIKSTHGDYTANPPLLLSGQPSSESFDAVIITTKSYHLETAIKDISPYISSQTMVLPLLNGIAHMDQLVEAFGGEAVIGGLCFIETTLDQNGTIVQTSPIHDLIFGERDGSKSERILALESAFSGTEANFQLSTNIVQDMWHKYSFITAMSGVTTLMRAPMGPIREQESGYRLIKDLLDEIYHVMKNIGAPVKEGLPEIQLSKMLEMGYTMKSSMQRDMEKLMPTETDHLQGFLLSKAAEKQLNTPLLNAVFANVKIYEEERA
ncbi:ketopantoate reductase family protein [Jeotgalibacillus proteolyticus]|uniref:2-dehydropantoate 2-reductase n=1 Tax=Jeotgalibacillus proteolyticus TaxID=2082395 RepID=A0A2S5GCJ7_9BACL|nr:ketopantoate reductase family protein [Jeotgalibacillus proteolyticus]PPA70645.1 oxidoreductase [Jeotgalibacillus proteolyticus]